MRYKKAQMEQLQGIIIAMVVVGIVLIVGFLIFDQTKDQVVTLIPTSTITNESSAYVNNTLIPLVHCADSVPDTITCTQVMNSSPGAHIQVINADNYTCNTTGLRVLDSEGNWSWSTMYVNYTYKPADYAFNATNVIQNATQDIPGWFPIIIVVVIGAVLIGLVSFLRRQT